MPRKSETTSFVARLWLESGPNGDPLWRGHVQHVQSDRSGFFDDLCGLRTFVEGVAGIAGPALQPRGRHAARLLAKTPGARRSAFARPSKKRNA